MQIHLSHRQQPYTNYDVFSLSAIADNFGSTAVIQFRTSLPKADTHSGSQLSVLLITYNMIRYGNTGSTLHRTRCPVHSKSDITDQRVEAPNDAGGMDHASAASPSRHMAPAQSSSQQQNRFTDAITNLPRYHTLPTRHYTRHRTLHQRTPCNITHLCGYCDK